jgi:S-adenosyl-L-methionine hydrolase (adenosine-forming)
MSGPVVTLLTDFGQRDGYVGAMKGVVLARSGALGVQMVDLTHGITPGAIAEAAYVLHQAARWFPKGTVHLAVVDPGVGSARRPLACRIGEQFFVGPDNGLFTHVLGGGALPCRAHSIAAPEFAPSDASPVFHGRDIFAPAAAHLVSGGGLAALGPAIPPESLVRLPWPEPQTEGDALRGSVVHVDHFGNLITNVPVASGGVLEGYAEIQGQSVRVLRTYSDAPRGALLAVAGSSGLLEIACNGASAAEALGVGLGAVVKWRPRERP